MQLLPASWSRVPPDVAGNRAAGGIYAATLAAQGVKHAIALMESSIYWDAGARVLETRLREAGVEFTRIPWKAEPETFERIRNAVSSCPLCANSGHHAAYSITSSIRASSCGGRSSPSILAVWASMTSSNLVACTTGRSAGLAPLRIRPA